MPAIILPGRYSVQPQGPVELDWNNGLVQALNPVGIWAFTQRGLPQNLVNGKYCTALNDAQVLPSQQGLSAWSPANPSSSTTTPNFNTEIYPDYTFRTLAAGFTWGATPPDGTNFPVSGIHDSTRRFYLGGAGGGSSTSRVFAWGSNGVNTGVDKAPVAFDTEVLSFSAEGQDVSGVTISCYLDGKRVAQNTGASWTGTATTRRFPIGKRTNASATDDYTVDLGPEVFTNWLVMAKNPVDAAVHRALRDEFWQVVRKPKSRLYFEFSAGDAAAGGATLTGTASISAGAATADSTADGATLTGTSSLEAGAGSSGGDASAGGATLTGTSSLSTGAASADSAAPGATITGSSSLSAGAASGADTVAPGATLTGTASISAGSATGYGTLTTPPLKNNTGTLLASETGITVNIYHTSTGVLVVQKTGQTTNASGVMTITDSALVPGTQYAYEPVLTAGRRRLPLATAT